VRCVPPENKPTPAEINTCRSFLEATIAEMRNLRAIITLGRISHESTVAALNHRRAAAPFAHGMSHDIGKVRLFVSYHCSRYNTNTGVLTPKMFQDVFAAAARLSGQRRRQSARERLAAALSAQPQRQDRGMIPGGRRRGNGPQPRSYGLRSQAITSSAFLSGGNTG
jgi:hypothetical protein